MSLNLEISYNCPCSFYFHLFALGGTWKNICLLCGANLHACVHEFPEKGGRQFIGDDFYF